MSNFQLQEIQISPKQSALEESISVTLSFSFENPSDLSSWWEAVFIVDIAYFKIQKPLQCTSEINESNGRCTVAISGFEEICKVNAIQLQNISMLQLKLRNRVELIADVNMVVQLCYDEGHGGYVKTILYGSEKDQNVHKIV
ncbi:oxysterols receptor LXR-beta [Perkinsela sp. CCAP 1560/4]|nr:oxysterols receptor LXR-beta [Perkinsela sp. CCAP 1560/4]|eukprot:KNH09362.1 oxysterols receptor LXR-beta [Perkinsela sp. CCAP 1560/4]